MATPVGCTVFEKELVALINRHSLESGSNSPDFLLAEFLTAQLKLFDITVNAREKWFGRTPAG